MPPRAPPFPPHRVMHDKGRPWSDGAKRVLMASMRHPVASRCVDCCHKWPPPSLPPSRYPYFRRQLYCSSLFPLPISRLPHPMRCDGRLPPSEGPPRFNEQFLPPTSISVSAAAAAYGQSVNGSTILSRRDARCQPEIGGASGAGVHPRPPRALSFVC